MSITSSQTPSFHGRREPGDEVKKVNSVETILIIVKSMALGRVRLKKSFFKGGCHDLHVQITVNHEIHVCI